MSAHANKLPGFIGPRCCSLFFAYSAAEAGALTFDEISTKNNSERTFRVAGYRIKRSIFVNLTHFTPFYFCTSSVINEETGSLHSINVIQSSYFLTNM